MTQKSTAEVSKSTDFTFLIYPDSAPEDWRLKLELLGIPMAISPVHNKDLTKDKTGYKKPHYHVLYRASNNVTANSVRNKLKRCLGQQAVAKVQMIATNMENAYLYLTHESKDAIAKRKHVYDKKDIVHLNNFDIERYIVIDAETKKDILSNLVQCIRVFKISNLPDLYNFLEEEGEGYGLTIKLAEEVIKANTGFLRLWFDGNYQKYHRSKEKEE